MLEKFSKSAVVRAGKVISAYNREPTPEVRAAFKLAHSWRLAHQAPMREVRTELSRLAVKAGGGGLTAARLKRFQSIRRKMRRRPITLYQMQDIAGCRAILPDMAAVNKVCAWYLNGTSKHELVGAGDDYIAKPKEGGYRSRHLVLRYAGPEEKSGGNRLTIEMQIRTRAQHAWATAVEAVGLVRREELKSGDGDPAWLRFFNLMASEMAADEHCPLIPGTPECPKVRRAEIIELNDSLNALRTLESYRSALHETERYKALAGQSYVLLFNSETLTVSVRSASSFARYGSARYDEEMMGEDSNIVRVEVDRVADLKEAYPNYFLDVRAFAQRVALIVGRSSLVQPSLDVYSPRYGLSWWFAGKRKGL